MTSLIKQFLNWIGVKERLHKQNHKPPLVSERDIWWISIGENIGSEINGKSSLFSRPAVIIKKLSHTFYLIVPTTSQKKEGTWYVPIKQEGKDMTVCLHQARTVDYRRLSNRLGVVDEEDFRRTKEAFLRLYK